MKKRIALVLSYILVAALATVITLAVTAMQAPAEHYSKLEQLSDLIDQRFIGETDRIQREDAAAAAMIDSLGDRWSYYIAADEYASHVEQMNNAYVGIGITITVAEDESGFLIMVVNEGGPAEEAGLQVNDVITAIGGHPCAGLDPSEGRNLVRGEEGTQIQITILRDGQEQTLDVTRRQVVVPVATWEMLPDNVGLITITNFDDRCSQETIAAIEQLRNQGAEKLLFDVRNNPGGYAHELVKVLDYLLPEGELFHTVDYSGKELFDYSDENHLDIPMAVLVNADSYSAAEFFAAALSEYDAAVVVGEQTSGKGHFQYTFQLNDGSAVGLSVGKYYTPNGLSLEGVGITPDVEVAGDEETYLKIYYGQLQPGEDPQIQAALEALK